MSPTTARIIMTVLAVGCAVLAVFVPQAAVVCASAATGLLAWAHAPVPGEAAKQQEVGAVKEATAQSIGLTTVGNQNLFVLPPIPTPPKNEVKE